MKKKRLFIVIMLVLTLCMTTACKTQEQRTVESAVEDIVKDYEEKAQDVVDSMLDGLDEEDMGALSDLNEDSSMEEIESVLGNLGDSKYSDTWDTSILPEGFPNEPKDTKTEATRYEPESKGPSWDEEPHQEWTISVFCNEEGYTNLQQSFLDAGFMGFIKIPGEYNDQLGAFYKDGYYVDVNGHEAYDTTMSEGYKYTLYIIIDILSNVYKTPEEVTKLIPEFTAGLPIPADEAGYIYYYDSEYNEVEKDSSAIDHWEFRIDYKAVNEEDIREYISKLESEGFTVRVDEESEEYIYVWAQKEDKQACYLSWDRKTLGIEYAASDRGESIYY